MDLYNLKRQLMDSAEAGAMATMKYVYPPFDELTLKQACDAAGSRRWLKYHLEKGNIRPKRRGGSKNSRLYYSRFEIYMLKKAEEAAQAELK